MNSKTGSNAAASTPLYHSCTPALEKKMLTPLIVYYARGFEFSKQRSTHPTLTPQKPSATYASHCPLCLLPQPLHDGLFGVVVRSIQCILHSEHLPYPSCRRDICAHAVFPASRQTTIQASPIQASQQGRPPRLDPFRQGFPRITYRKDLLAGS